MSTPPDNQEALADFLARHAKPYDPVTDDYERDAFASDIKEGKNDPIYNAHTYHTKVPPRSIIPYILHYTQPGDLVLKQAHWVRELVPMKIFSDFTHKIS